MSAGTIKVCEKGLNERVFLKYVCLAFTLTAENVAPIVSGLEDQRDDQRRRDSWSAVAEIEVLKQVFVMRRVSSSQNHSA